MTCKAQAVGYWPSADSPTRPPNRHDTPVTEEETEAQQGSGVLPSSSSAPTLSQEPAGQPSSARSRPRARPPTLAGTQADAGWSPLKANHSVGDICWDAAVGAPSLSLPLPPRCPVSIRVCHRLQNGIWVPGPGARPQGLLTLRGTEAAHGGCPASTCRAVCRVQALSTGSVYTGPPASLLGNKERGMHGLASQVLR